MAITGSNIFGLTYSTAEPPLIPYTTSGTTIAARLIDKIQNVADNSFNKVIGSVDLVVKGADAGQREMADGFVKYQNKRPTPLTSGNILAGWTNPSMPTLPAFPSLPDDLKVDMAAFKTNVDDRIQKLKDSWFMQYLPASTDISRYDTLMTQVLGSSGDTAALSKLEALESELKNALTNIMSSLNTDITTHLATMRTALTARKGQIDPKVLAAITAANDNTADIAFARARDQIAREGLRLENEAYAEMAARGFALPNGVLLASQAMARQATLDGASKIAAEEALRAQEANVELAKISIDAWIKATDFDLRADIENVRQTLEPRLRHAQMEMDANRAKAKQAFEHLGLRLDFTKFGADFALKYRTACAENLNGLINAYANMSRNEMDYLARIAEAQRANLNALIDYYKVSLLHADMGFKAAQFNTESDLKYAAIAGDFIGKAVGHHVAAGQTVATMYAQVAAAALSGLNGVASQTSTG